MTGVVIESPASKKSGTLRSCHRTPQDVQNPRAVRVYQDTGPWMLRKFWATIKFLNQHGTPRVPQGAGLPQDP